MGDKQIKVYITSVGGASHSVKKNCSHVLDVLAMRKIPYELIDISSVEDDVKEFFWANGRHHGTKKPLTPQIFCGNECCGDYDEFALAVEDDKLDEFLKLAPATEKSSVQLSDEEDYADEEKIKADEQEKDKTIEEVAAEEEEKAKKGEKEKSGEEEQDTFTFTVTDAGTEDTTESENVSVTSGEKEEKKEEAADVTVSLGGETKKAELDDVPKIGRISRPEDEEEDFWTSVEAEVSDKKEEKEEDKKEKDKTDDSKKSELDDVPKIGKISRPDDEEEVDFWASVETEVDSDKKEEKKDEKEEVKKDEEKKDEGEKSELDDVPKLGRISRPDDEEEDFWATVETELDNKEDKKEEEKKEEKDKIDESTEARKVDGEKKTDEGKIDEVSKKDEAEKQKEAAGSEEKKEDEAGKESKEEAKEEKKEEKVEDGDEDDFWASWGKADD